MKKKTKLSKKFCYWTEGDEGSGDKLYLGFDPKKLIYHLEKNGPILCGADLMTEKQLNRLPKG